MLEIPVESILTTIGVLAAAIGTLWALLIKYNKREQERLKKCEEMHEKSQNQVIELTGDFRELKGRIDAVEQLSKAVLEKIEEHKCGDNK